MIAISDDTGGVRLEILRLRPELAIGTGEKQVVADQSIQRGDVCRELSIAQLRFEFDDFVIGRALQCARDSIYAPADGHRPIKARVAAPTRFCSQKTITCPQALATESVSALIIRANSAIESGVTMWSSHE